MLFGTIREFFNLLLVGFANMFYNIALAGYETILFGRKLWWWKLWWAFYTGYLVTFVRPLIRKESSNLPYEEDTFIYGETPCLTTQKILEYAGAKPGDLYIDLGCGRGLTVFFARYLNNLESKGCDLIPTFIRKARTITKNLKLDNVSFHEQDIIDADISRANIIYIAGTTFQKELRDKLPEKLRQAKPGTVIVTLSFYLPENGFILYREQELLFSWGKSTAYFHRRT